MARRHATQPIPESEYLSLLGHERHMYAWCLHRYAHIDAAEAEQRAKAFYVYEPPTVTNRGLLFHDFAWAWAMKHIFGSTVWQDRPDLCEPSAEYVREDETAG